MSHEIRPISPDEFDAFSAAAAIGFGNEVNDDNRERERQIYEFDRSLAVFDGEDVLFRQGASPEGDKAAVHPLEGCHELVRRLVEIIAQGHPVFCGIHRSVSG